MKKRVEIYLVLLIICLSHFEAIADNISLNGSWELTYFPQPREAVRTPGDLQKIKGSTIKAMVPGNVELDMLTEGIIESLEGKNISDDQKTQIVSCISEYIIECFTMDKEIDLIN